MSLNNDVKVHNSCCCIFVFCFFVCLFVCLLLLCCCLGEGREGYAIISSVFGLEVSRGTATYL